MDRKEFIDKIHEDVKENKELIIPKYVIREILSSCARCAEKAIANGEAFNIKDIAAFKIVDGKERKCLIVEGGVLPPRKRISVVVSNKLREAVRVLNYDN